MAACDNLNTLDFRSGMLVQNLTINAAPASDGFNQNIRSNTKKMGDVNLNDYKVGLNPQTAAQVPTNFANFADIQGQPRSMLLVLRYSF